MNKKEYLKPESKTIVMEGTEILAGSDGTGIHAGEHPKVDGDEDGVDDGSGNIDF
ncbi:unknown [Prevotella sp. CAG:487]|jgi:hypothetical protein|nr:unknown [Prevotella sp. CAG:487]